MHGKAILVTGGAGFIGSHLVERLLDDGVPVTVLDNFDPYYDPRLKRENLASSAERPGFRLVEGDIRDETALESVFSGTPFGSVIHLAARAGVRPSILDPGLYASVNVDGTTRLLEACRRHGVSRFVFGSSSSVYGNNDRVPFHEEHSVDHPVSPYAASKKAGELMGHVYHHLNGMHVACLRFFTVYGPRQRPEMAIHKFARRIAAGREIEQYGDGGSSRDFTYVSDIVDGILAAHRHCRGYRIWNLGGSHPVALSELIGMLGREMGIEPRIRVVPSQAGDVERTWADTTRARDELGWAPRVELEDGIRRFLKWFHARPEAGGRTE